MSDSDEVISINDAYDSEASSDFAPKTKKVCNATERLTFAERVVSNQTKAAPVKAPAKAPAKKATATKATVSTKTAVAPKKKKPLQSIDDNVDSAMEVDDSDDSDDDIQKTKLAPVASKNKKTASETYQQLTPIEHILKRPDSYIGSIETHTEKLWVFDSDTKRMVYRYAVPDPAYSEDADLCRQGCEICPWFLQDRRRNPRQCGRQQGKP